MAEYSCLGDECHWPHDQSYASACRHCEKIFYGPKHAPSCWRRQTEENKERWLSKFKEG